MIGTSIVVSTFNRDNLLKHHLLSIRKQLPTKRDFEVIVVDDYGQTDSTRILCELFAVHFPVKYLNMNRSPESVMRRRIPGFALNAGVNFASYDVVILCCAEMYILNNAIDLLSEPFHSTSCDIMTLPVGYADDGSALDCLDVGKRISYKVTKNLKPLNTLFPFYMGVRRESFVSIGGYDEDFVGSGWDDNDFVHRMIWNGAHYVPTSAEVCHLYHPRSYNVALERYNRALYRRKQFVVGRNRVHGSPTRLTQEFAKKDVGSGSVVGWGDKECQVVEAKRYLGDIVRRYNVRRMLCVGHLNDWVSFEGVEVGTEPGKEYDLVLARDYQLGKSEQDILSHMLTLRSLSSKDAFLYVGTTFPESRGHPLVSNFEAWPYDLGKPLEFVIDGEYIQSMGARVLGVWEIK